ncbi:MAG: hypothetical protein M1836_004164 [Candelina mexicana]|nr:MAG: hypothetical protein M1836_004164 [Candelina mexicana]
MAANDDAHSAYADQARRFKTLETQISTLQETAEVDRLSMRQEIETLRERIASSEDHIEAANANRSRFFATIKRAKGDRSQENQALINAGNDVAHRGAPVWDAQLCRRHNRDFELFREVYDISTVGLQYFKDSDLALEIFRFHAELYAEDTLQKPSEPFKSPRFMQYYQLIRDMMSDLEMRERNVAQEFCTNKELLTTFEQLRAEYRTQRSRARYERRQ